MIRKGYNMRVEFRILIVSLACAAITMSVGCSAKRCINQLNTLWDMPDAVVVVYAPRDGTWLIRNKEVAETRVAPCSTFKILNSAIGLETGVLSDQDHLLKRDPSKAPFQDGWPKSWESDHTLKSAVANSVVWYFQEVARKIGSKRMRHYLSLAQYGNRDMSGGLDHFWLRSSLKISPVEQVQFLDRFFSGKLRFSKRTVDIVKDILPSETTPDYTWRGKTGTCVEEDGTMNAWLIGQIEKRENTYLFSVYIQKARNAEERDNRRLSVVRHLAKQLP